MIKTLNPYPNPAKTAEIMSRYRPIAPKPDTNSSSSSRSDGSNNNNSLSQKIKQSPYLRNLWPQLQARPTRTRKRGRAPITLPSSLKRHKTTTTTILGFCPPCHVASPSKNLALQGFAQPHHQQQLTIPNIGLGLLNCQLQLEKTNAISTTNIINNINNNNNNPSLVTLPLLPCSPSPPICTPSPKFDITKIELETIDLNLNNLNTSIIPEEKDLLQQLQRPTPPPPPPTTTTTKSNNNNNNNNVIIAPQPIRPIGSCISVGCISEDPTLTTTTTTSSSTSQTHCHQPLKRKEEVEEEVESEALPAIISDSNNRVRMANSAYREMVGQPECPWLESMVSSCKSKKRISGEVTLHLCDSRETPLSSNGFSCWVRIEWQSSEERNKKCSVNAFCDVIKVCCESRDYVFIWRFHTRPREASQYSCNV